MFLMCWFKFQDEYSEEEKIYSDTNLQSNLDFFFFLLLFI